MNREQYNRLGSHEVYRDDNYDYCHFFSEESPDGVLLARQIQAQSYVNMKITRPEAVVELPNGAQVLADEATNPSGVAHEPVEGFRTEYILGLKKGTTDLNPVTGELVTWRKSYAALEQLPAYQFLKSNLFLEGKLYLQAVEADPSLVLVEPEGLGKTKNAKNGVIKEFIRSEIQRSLGRGEVWFMGLVEGTTYRSFVHNWGSAALRQIGAARPIVNNYTHRNVALVPTVLDVDNFYRNLASDIAASQGVERDTLLASFVYMTEGASDEQLGAEAAALRQQIRYANPEEGGNS